MTPEGRSRQTERTEIFFSFKATKCETHFTKNRLCQLFLWYFICPADKKSLYLKDVSSQSTLQEIYMIKKVKYTFIYIYIQLYYPSLQICASIYITPSISIHNYQCSLIQQLEFCIQHQIIQTYCQICVQQGSQQAKISEVVILETTTGVRMQ